MYQYYLPVAMWILGQLEAHRASGAGCVALRVMAHAPAKAGWVPCLRPWRTHLASFLVIRSRPLVVGISAPQGCGKTTIVECLTATFKALGIASASVSIDDFYLTRAEQVALAARDPDNPLLQLRGNAGSHDVALGTRTLDALRGLTSAGDEARIPRYDKSSFSGKGDRCPEEDWESVRGPLDVVLFEGWMLGFTAVGAERASAVSPSLVEVDRHLAAYREAWDSRVDAWVVVQVGSPEWVFEWRLQAEHRMRATGKAGMTDQEVRDFCERFQPAYRLYLPGLYEKGPTTASSGKLLRLRIGQDRTLLSTVRVVERDGGGLSEHHARLLTRPPTHCVQEASSG